MSVSICHGHNAYSTVGIMVGIQEFLLSYMCMYASFLVPSPTTAATTSISVGRSFLATSLCFAHFIACPPTSTPCCWSLWRSHIHRRGSQILYHLRSRRPLHCRRDAPTIPHITICGSAIIGSDTIAMQDHQTMASLNLNVLPCSSPRARLAVEM